MERSRQGPVRDRARRVELGAEAAPVLAPVKLLAPFAAVLAALAGAILLDGAPPRADLVFVNRAEIFTLDPQRMSWIQDFRMGDALYEGLGRWHTSGLPIQPAAPSPWR